MARVKAKGIILKYGDSASPSTTIPQKADISYDAGSWDMLDGTNHDSGSTKVKEPGLKEPPSLNVNVLLDPGDTAHAWLVSANDSGALKYFTLVLPDTGAAQFVLSGYVQTLSITGPVNDYLKASFTIICAAAAVFSQ